MEVDAFGIAVLAITGVRAAAVPCWVLAIGAMRYLYLGARIPIPPGPAPPAAATCGGLLTRRRKTIAVVQSLALLDDRVRSR